MIRFISFFLIYRYDSLTFPYLAVVAFKGCMGVISIARLDWEDLSKSSEICSSRFRVLFLNKTGFIWNSGVSYILEPNLNYGVS